MDGTPSMARATPGGDLSDAGLAARCRTGDDAAWSQLVERFSRYVYAITVQGFRLQEADADDVFQEVFSRTFEHLDKLRDDSAIRPWLGQLTRRLCIDRLRDSGRVSPSGEVEVLAEGGEQEIHERIDEALVVREGLLSLSDECQEILDRFFARDQSYRTISGALEIPQGTIASRISRCLVKLKETLAE